MTDQTIRRSQVAAVFLCFLHVLHFLYSTSGAASSILAAAVTTGGPPTPPPGVPR